MNSLFPEMLDEDSDDSDRGRDGGDLPYTSYKHTHNLNHQKKEEFERHPVSKIHNTSLRHLRMNK